MTTVRMAVLSPVDEPSEVEIPRRPVEFLGGPHDTRTISLPEGYHDGDEFIITDDPSASHHPVYELDEDWLVFAGWRVAH